MGGPLPRASILLLGDAGSGKTILSYQLLHDELESDELCALLSYRRVSLKTFKPE